MVVLCDAVASSTIPVNVKVVVAAIISGSVEHPLPSLSATNDGPANELGSVLPAT